MPPPNKSPGVIDDTQKKMMVHLFGLEAVHGTRMQLRVKPPTRDNPLSVLQVHAPHNELPPVARKGENGTAVFACVDYRETSTMHYTAPDWIERYRALYMDTESSGEDEYEDDALLIARNDRARAFKARRLGGEFAPPHGLLLRDLHNGIFSRLDEALPTRLLLHSLTMYLDDTPGATSVTTGAPLRLILGLLLEREVADGADEAIGGVRVHSIRLDMRSV